MDQNQTADNDDLQKAIDDITNTTNIDPVFSDPVAAPSSVPEGDTGELGEPVGPFPEPIPEPTPAINPPEPPLPPKPEETSISEFNMSEISMPNIPTIEPSTPNLQPTSLSQSSLNMHQIKEAALRDLVPLIDRLNMSPSQKFHIYRDVFEDLKDYTVLESAYRAASAITDDTERAEALLYLVESIDKM